ncbi:MAG: phage baseplate assembly protein V [Opitutales bacterium]
MSAPNDNGEPRFYGKYRGTVINNIDPEFRARLLVQVPDVLGPTPSSWAEACTPLAGPTGPPMGAYLVPPIGAGVWVEFEQGDPEYPIWVGCRFASSADIPPTARAGLPVSPSIVLQTAGQNSLTISDAPGPAGGILLKTLTGALISINDVGITLSNGKGAVINMVGPTTDLHAGALTIT